MQYLFVKSNHVPDKNMGGGHDKRGRAGEVLGPVGRLDANVGVCAATHSMDRATDRSNERSLGMAIIIAFAMLTSPLPPHTRTRECNCFPYLSSLFGLPGAR